MKIATGTTLIKNGQLIDCTGREPVLNAAVVIREGRIVFVGPMADVFSLPLETETIDAYGGTIMPGLVEAHFQATYFNIASPSKFTRSAYNTTRFLVALDCTARFDHIRKLARER